ncbi:hypothetical protein Trisim1_011765 [Trichoderma cf. simile WF8]
MASHAAVIPVSNSCVELSIPASDIRTRARPSTPSSQQREARQPRKLRAGVRKQNSNAIELRKSRGDISLARRQPGKVTRTRTRQRSAPIRAATSEDRHGALVGQRRWRCKAKDRMKGGVKVGRGRSRGMAAEAITRLESDCIA